MANTRKIAWSAAMQDLRNDRADAAVVREEGLKAAAGLARPLDLSAWRGRSGRRYVVGVRPLAELSDITDAVVLGVRRGADGAAGSAQGGGQPSEDRVDHAHGDQVVVRGAHVVRVRARLPDPVPHQPEQGLL